MKVKKTFYIFNSILPKLNILSTKIKYFLSTFLSYKKRRKKNRKGNVLLFKMVFEKKMNAHTQKKNRKFSL